ncbi:reverse transcriptase domain-containing protein [Tanacetum coccineum]
MLSSGSTSVSKLSLGSSMLVLALKEEYDIWAMEMEHYLEYIDNDVWKVIQNGNSKKRISTGKDGVVRILPPVSAAEIHAFRGLEKGYDRFQQLLSQLEAHGAEVSTEDANYKFLRSLPPAWSNLAMTMRTKPDVDTLSIDDLYNNLRVFEQELTSTSKSSTSAQNVAFVSHSKSNTNKVKSVSILVPTVLILFTFSNYIQEREVLLVLLIEVIFTLFAKHSDDLDFFHERHMNRLGPQKLKFVDADDNNSYVSIYLVIQMIVEGSCGNTFEHSSESESESISVPNEMCASKSDITNEQVVSESKEVEPSCATHELSRPNFNCDSGPTFIRTVNAKGPQGRPKPVKAWAHGLVIKDHLDDFEECKGGSVTFGGSKGYITGKGRIRVGNLDFDSVSFVKELGHFNLFSISQICDKQHKVLFTETECLVVSLDFKMPDENQILLKVPRQNNMYSFDMKTPGLTKDYACLIAKATSDESKLWGTKRIERTVGENRASWSDRLDDALWAFRTAYKTPIGCTPYKLVYGKSCHLPIELEHRAYWALKHANFDLKTAGDHRKLQLNELNELRDQAYENSLIYKERTKKLHDSKIKNRIFNVGDQVLLFNSRLKIFSGKLKTRWSGPFTITEVFPIGTAKIISLAFYAY